MTCGDSGVDSALPLCGFLLYASLFLIFVLLVAHLSLIIPFLLSSHLLFSYSLSTFPYFNLSSSVFISSFFFQFFCLFLVFYLNLSFVADERGIVLFIFVLMFFLISFLSYLHSSSTFSHHPKYVHRFPTYLSSEIIFFSPRGS